MKIILYGVGDHIETGDYSNKVIGLRVEKVSSSSLLYSLDSKNVQYFLSEAEADKFARNNVIYNQGSVKAQGVFRLEIKVSDTGEFQVEHIVSGYVSFWPCVEINKPIKHYSKSFTNLLTCNKNNFHGDFEKLQRMVSNKQGCFMFLHGNRHGLMPVDQENIYSIPRGVDKEICKYALSSPRKDRK